MSNNEINNETIKHANFYSDSKGTGVISTLIFAVVTVVIMVAIAYFKGF